jgi:hypothetical protein
LLGASALVLALAAPAAAQLDDDLEPATREFESPERFALELRIGPYAFEDSGIPAFETIFGDDSGPMLALELDVFGLRVEDALYVGGAGGIGWAKFTGNTLNMGEPTSEETKLSLVPLDLAAVVRLDILSRRFSIPFNFAGKLGYRWVHWSTSSGGQRDASGWSGGPWWAVQIALDLDVFEPGQARMLDEEWGINHSFLFFELYGFHPGSGDLEVGTDLGWFGGLGLIF